MTLKAQNQVKISVEWNRGIAYAVAELLRRGELSIAQEIWEASGAVLAGVDEFDAKQIRAAIVWRWNCGAAS